MSNIGTRQAAIVAAISALGSFSGKDVKTARSYRDAFATLRDGACVVYDGWESGSIGGGSPGAPLIGNKTMTIGRERWGIVVMGTSLRAATDMETRSGGIFDLVEALRAIRSTTIGNDTRGTSIYLMLQSERLEEDPNATAPNGGAAGYVCLYQTTQMFA